MRPFIYTVKHIITVLFLAFLGALNAQDTTSVKKTTVPAAAPAAQSSSKKWYDLISMRGYAQVRYNRLLETNPDLKCEQCDRYWGDNNGLGIPYFS